MLEVEKGCSEGSRFGASRCSLDLLGGSFGAINDIRREEIADDQDTWTERQGFVQFVHDRHLSFGGLVRFCSKVGGGEYRYALCDLFRQGEFGGFGLLRAWLSANSPSDLHSHSRANSSKSD